MLFALRAVLCTLFLISGIHAEEHEDRYTKHSKLLKNINDKIFSLQSKLKLKILKSIDKKQFQKEKSDLVLVYTTALQRVGSFVPRETLNPGVEDDMTAVFRDRNGGFVFPGSEGEFNSVTTLPTYPKRISTDIPQDFPISRSDVDYLQIPTGATNIAFSASDSFFSDNSDYDKDFGVVIKITIKKAKQIPLF